MRNQNIRKNDIRRKRERERRVLKKGKSNKCNIKEDGLLVEEVRKYPCLYDKSLPTYKEKDRKANAWRAVETELGLEEGILFLETLIY